MASYNDRQHLIPPGRASFSNSYGGINKNHNDDIENPSSSSSRAGSKTTNFTHRSAVLSFHEENDKKNLKSSFMSDSSSTPQRRPPNTTTTGTTATTTATTTRNTQRFVYYIIYALVNVIISAPGLYGYAAVIFNHPIFENHMNALSKLVIFSSLIHQLGFFLFSSLDFAIGTVQDAGLIFLSGMANKIANRMQDEGKIVKRKNQGMIVTHNNYTDYRKKNLFSSLPPFSFHLHRSYRRRNRFNNFSFIIIRNSIIRIGFSCCW